MTQRVGGWNSRDLRIPPLLWGLAALALLLLWAGFRDGVEVSAQGIWEQPEYSHGLLIPFISLFLIWQRRDVLSGKDFGGSWIGILVLSGACVANALGALGSIFIVQQYAAVMALYGLVLALVGLQFFRFLWVPLLLILFMIPLPDFLYSNLSAKLQLISSQIGVAVIRLFGISVHLEGNVIDLGVYKLQVADACSGLRYLFPLMTLGFIMAYFFQGAFWKRAVLFLSSIPITILMNSVRIGIIGVLVEHHGIGQAEGLLHDFEGWVIFMASLGVMVLEIMLLAHIGRDRRAWRQVFGVEFPAPRPAGITLQRRPVPVPFVASIVVLGLAVVVDYLMPQRVPVVPVRQSFVDFPAEVDGETARRASLQPVYQDVLKLDDYLLASYASRNLRPVNFYVAWYDTQQAGRSAHSPRSCLPGGGWAIESLEQVAVPGVRLSSQPLYVNRAVIRLGNSRQLVYYFFKQRQRLLTSEYAVKWFLMWDSLTRNRTDGALVRLTVPVPPGDSLEEGDMRLRRFMADAAPKLVAFLPD